MNNIKGTIKEKLLGILFVFSLILAGGYNQIYKSPTHKPSKMPSDGYNDEDIKFRLAPSVVMVEPKSMKINGHDSEDQLDDHIVLRFIELFSGERIRKQ